MGFILIVLICIGAYVYFNQNGCCAFRSASSHQDAIDILRARYARGEISSEEFNERKKGLEWGYKK